MDKEEINTADKNSMIAKKPILLIACRNEGCFCGVSF
jgi:hypothetical protein